MEKQAKEKETKREPIRLTDLLPRDDVSGGGRKTIFGMVKRSSNKQQEQ